MLTPKRGSHSGGVKIADEKTSGWSQEEYTLYQGVGCRVTSQVSTYVLLWRIILLLS